MKTDIRQIVAKNLTDWMSAHPDLDTLKKVATRSGVGFGTVRRAKTGSASVTIANLADIAKAFGRPVEDMVKIEGGDSGVTSPFVPLPTEEQAIDLFARLSDHKKELFLAKANVRQLELRTKSTGEIKGASDPPKSQRVG